MSGTSPDSVAYPPQEYGLLGPFVAQAFNVQDFGAIGDGSNDDSTAIQEALDAAAAAGLPVFVPAGVYICAGLTWPTGLKLLLGVGRRLSVFRRPPAATSGSNILTITSQSDFEVREMGFDGDRDNQTVRSYNILLSACYNFKFIGCSSDNAKELGNNYGNGWLVNNSPYPNSTGWEIRFQDCEGYGNGAEAIRFQNTGAALTVEGGNFSSNFGSGVSFTAPQVGLSNVVPAPRFNAVRAEYNDGSGISVSGYFDTNGNYGNSAQRVVGAIISNCQCNHNTGYGIVVQCDGASVTGNTAMYNGGSPASSKAGILVNATNVKVIGNYLTHNTTWGIDLGGAQNTQVVANTLSFNETGMNIGGCQQIIVQGNLFEDNTGNAIAINRFDGGNGYGFPLPGSGITIDANRFINTISNTLTGIGCYDNPYNITVTNNRFVWPDSTGNQCIILSTDSGLCRGNALERANTTLMQQFQMNAATSLNIPDWADEILVNTSTTITNILTRTYLATTQRLQWIELTDPGSGYTSDPTVTITGGGGSDATATAVRKQDGTLAFIRVQTSGTGYTSTPTVTITGGGGSGATAVAYSGAVVPVRGREITLVALGTTINLTYGSNLVLPVAVGETLSLPAGSRITFRAAGNDWQCQSIVWAGGDGQAASWTLTGKVQGAQFEVGSGGPRIVTGTGAPSVVLSLPRGTFYLRSDGGVGSTVYVSQGGGTWNAIAGV